MAERRSTIDKAQADEARRQGQFEGQVLTTLTDIKSQVHSVSQNGTSLEGRTRVLENVMVKHDEMFKDMQDTQKAIVTRLENGERKTAEVTTYQNKQKGFLLAAGFAGSVLGSVLTAVIIKYI